MKKINNYGDFLNLLFLLILAYLLIIFSTFRLFGEDIDYKHYINMFNYGYHEQEGTKELSFVFFRYLSHVFFDSSYQVFLFFYAFIAILTKFLIFNNFSKIPFFSVLLYVLTYYLLHDYTQIRVGVAAAFLLVSLYALSINNLWLFFASILFGVFFHWISLFVLIIYPIYKFIPLRIIYLLPFLSLIVYFNKSLVLSFVGWFFSLNEYLNLYYSNHAGHVENFNTFNVLFILNIIVYFSFFLFNKVDFLYNKKDFNPVLLSVFSFSIFFYVVSSTLNLPVISHRVYEFFNFVLIILIPNFVSLFPVLVSRALILFYFIIFYFYFYHLLFNVNIFPLLSDGF